MLGDGTGVVQGVDPVTDTRSERSTSTESLGLRAPDAAEVRAFTRIPVFERVRRGKSSAGLFLGAVSRVAVMGPRLCAGYAIRWEIRCFDRPGKLLSRTIRDTRPGKVTEADVVLPARFSLLDAGRDYVAGVLLDEDDAESVVVYRLRR